jgi:predicted O-linked N-acetylglucosamine transferase (SPINDLY family)
MADWIAKDKDEYVEIAANWGSKVEELAHLRLTMRDRLHTSPLFMPELFARNFEKALVAMLGATK